MEPASLRKWFPYQRPTGPVLNFASIIRIIATIFCEHEHEPI